MTPVAVEDRGGIGRVIGSVLGSVIAPAGAAEIDEISGDGDLVARNDSLQGLPFIVQSIALQFEDRLQTLGRSKANRTV